MERSQELWAFLDSQRDARVAEIAAEQEQHLSAIPEPALLWLALVPFWTVTLAEACHFPGADHGVRELFMSLYKEGFCEYVPAPPLWDEDADSLMPRRSESGNDCFNLTDALRGEVLQRAISNQGEARLLGMMQNIGVTIRETGLSDIPAPIARWAALAVSAFDAVRAFEKQVVGLLAKNELNEVQGWIEAARWLETIAGTELTRMIDRMARRLELRHRRSYDEQFLTHFLRRDEQVAAFTALLKSSDKYWALHYVGPGGVGKTMLVRYLTTRYFTEHDLKPSICRIDFDYLNPDYPTRAPGLLLDQISQELRLYGGDQADKEFIRFDSLVRKLHERLGSANVSNLMPARLLDDSDFDQLIQTFIRAIGHLPQPIVLILDTCEELAKIRPDGTIPENVRATFAILARIHQDLSTLRVVFSGRRPLARAGYGWECPTSPHPERPYLRLHEIRGFDSQDARHYLLDRAQVRAELVEAIIQKSLDKGTIDLFRWKNQRNAPSSVTRYNPFDLALYASWAREDASLSGGEMSAAGVDRYIEGRILGRIHHPHVRTLLPAGALLGTFDRVMLRVVAHSDERRFNDSFQELTNQEWIQQQQFIFWHVKSGLRERLYAYYRERYPQTLADARKQLLPYLKRITLDRRLSSLNVPHFDAALRLLEEDDPQDAASWWTAIEKRFADEGNAYDWALTLIEQLQSEDGAIAEVDSSAAAQGSVESRLRPAVLATYASAQLHARPSISREAIWEEVLNKVERHPLPEEVVRLRIRAQAGLVMARRSIVQSWLIGVSAPIAQDDAELRTLLNLLAVQQATDLDEQLAACLIAGLEVVVEYGENTAHDLPWRSALQFVAQLDKARISPELQAFSLALAGRIYILLRQWENALSHFRRVLSLLPGLAMGQQHWLDWLAPEDLSARLRLEFARALYPTVLSAQDVLTQIGSELPDDPPPTDDADRLGSAILLLRSAVGSLPTIDQISSRSVKYSVPSNQPLRNAHRAFQALKIALAETMAALGQPDQALPILEQLSLQAEASTADLDTVFAADRAKLRIVRRWRLRDEGYGFHGFLKNASQLTDNELEWTLDGLDGPKSLALNEVVVLGTVSLSRLQARWRTSYTLDYDMREKALEEIAPDLLPALPYAGSSFPQFSWFFDVVEMKRLSANHVLPFSLLTRQDIANVANAAITWAELHPESPLEAIRLLLRASALAPQDASKRDFSLPVSLLERVGQRCAAEIALDEGEMLALRLPDLAVPLLSQARDLFQQVNDSVGEIIAATCLALTLARLIRRAEVLPVLDQILATYSDLYKLYAPLPPLRELAERVDLDSLPSGKGGWPQHWRPWLARLVACIIWSRDDAQRAARMAALRHWLESHYSAHLANGENALPAEFDGWLVEPEPQGAPTRSGSTNTEAPSTEFTERFVLDITGSYAGPYQITAQISLTRRIQNMIVETYKRTLIEISILAPYRETVEKWIEIAPPLSPQQSLFYKTTIELRTDEFSSAICWEMLISLWLEVDNTSWVFHHADLYRTVHRREVREARSLTRLESDFEAVIIAPHAGLYSQLTSTWASRMNGQWQPTFMLSTEIFRRGGSASRVVHLIANAQEANGTPFLDVSTDVTGKQSNMSSQERGRLLRAEELSRIFPNLTICLLQSLPAPFTRRSETDRENAAWQRRFAAELHASGVPVVIVIPPLSEESILKILRPLVVALSQKPLLSGALFDALGTAREATMQEVLEVGGSREDALETAFDLCLYLASELVEQEKE